MNKLNDKRNNINSSVRQQAEFVANDYENRASGYYDAEIFGYNIGDSTTAKTAQEADRYEQKANRIYVALEAVDSGDAEPEDYETINKACAECRRIMARQMPLAM
jgi:hypothetical protein